MPSGDGRLSWSVVYERWCEKTTDWWKLIVFAWLCCRNVAQCCNWTSWRLSERILKPRLSKSTMNLYDLIYILQLMHLQWLDYLLKYCWSFESIKHIVNMTDVHNSSSLVLKFVSCWCCVCLVNKIRETWYHVYRRHFLQQSLTTAGNCRKGFYYYQKGFEETGVSWHISADLVHRKWKIMLYIDWVVGQFLKWLAITAEGNRWFNCVW